MCLYMGHSILQSKLKALLSSAGLDPAGKSNHSLRLTARYLSHVQFRSARKAHHGRSGHLSSKGVQAFERTTTKQQRLSVVFWLRKGKPMEGTWQPLKQRGNHGLVEVQPNEDQMAENMAEGLQQTSQVIKMEGCSCSGHHNAAEAV